MPFRYEAIECIKPIDMKCADFVPEDSYKKWWRIKDVFSNLYLPGGFDTKEAAEACCEDLNRDKV